jgi:hypothetical protein
MSFNQGATDHQWIVTILLFYSRRLQMQACLPADGIYSNFSSLVLRPPESYSAFLRRSTISPTNKTAAITQMIRTIEASIVDLLPPVSQNLRSRKPFIGVMLKKKHSPRVGLVPMATEYQ